MNDGDDEAFSRLILSRKISFLRSNFLIHLELFVLSSRNNFSLIIYIYMCVYNGLDNLQNEIMIFALS